MKSLKKILLFIIGLFLLIIIVLAGIARLAAIHQQQNIITSYYREVAAGKVPMPMNTNSIRVFRFEPGAPLDRVLVETESGKHWFFAKSTDGSGTNWVFIPR
jgi:hypothetical protein